MAKSVANKVVKALGDKNANQERSKQKMMNKKFRKVLAKRGLDSEEVGTYNACSREQKTQFQLRSA